MLQVNVVRSLRASLSASSREIDGTLKKLKDKKERVAAAEAKPKKADKVGAGTRYTDKAGTTIFDLDWGSTTLGGKPVEFVADPRLEKGDLTAPFLTEAAAVRQFCKDNQQFLDYLTKFLNQAPCPLCFHFSLHIVILWLLSVE